MVLHLKKHESLSSKDACAKIGWNWLSGSWEEDFLISSMYFRHFVIISHWKRAGPFIWTNLNPLHPRMLCAKFGWNWPSGSGEEDENVKCLQTDRQTDDGRQVIRKAHLSFQLRWANKTYAYTVYAFGNVTSLNRTLKEHKTHLIFLITRIYPLMIDKIDFFLLNY